MPHLLEDEISGEAQDEAQNRLLLAGSHARREMHQKCSEVLFFLEVIAELRR